MSKYKPAFRRQRLANVCEFKASLVYIVDSRIARAKCEILSPKQTNKQKMQMSKHKTKHVFEKIMLHKENTKQ